MKLQRNNKYSGKIAKKIGAFTLIATLLSGCSNEETLVDAVLPTPGPTSIVIEETIEPNVTEEPTISEENEYSLPWELEESVLIEQIELLEIKDSNKQHVLGEYAFLEFLDCNGNKRVMITRSINKDSKVVVYDAFTDTEVFRTLYDDKEKYDVDFSVFWPSIPLFEDATILRYDFFIETYNTALELGAPHEYVRQFVHIGKPSDEVYCTDYDMAYSYVSLIPIEMRVAAFELSSDYCIESDKVKVLG